MTAELSGVFEGFGKRLGRVRKARVGLRARLRRIEADPERAAVLRVVVDYRVCRCGGWLVHVVPAGMPPRALHAADADEADHAVRYELDVIMSETGRDVAPHPVLPGDRPTGPPPGGYF